MQTSIAVTHQNLSSRADTQGKDFAEAVNFYALETCPNGMPVMLVSHFDLSKCQTDISGTPFNGVSSTEAGLLTVYNSVGDGSCEDGSFPARNFAGSFYINKGWTCRSLPFGANTTFSAFKYDVGGHATAPISTTAVTSIVRASSTLALASSSVSSLGVQSKESLQSTSSTSKKVAQSIFISNDSSRTVDLPGTSVAVDQPDQQTISTTSNKVAQSISTSSDSSRTVKLPGTSSVVAAQPEQQNTAVSNPGSRKENRPLRILIIVAGLALFLILLFVALCIIRKRRRQHPTRLTSSKISTSSIEQNSWKNDDEKPISPARSTGYLSWYLRDTDLHRDRHELPMSDTASVTDVQTILPVNSSYADFRLAAPFGSSAGSIFDRQVERRLAGEQSTSDVETNWTHAPKPSVVGTNYFQDIDLHTDSCDSPYRP